MPLSVYNTTKSFELILVASLTPKHDPNQELKPHLRRKSVDTNLLGSFRESLGQF